jgi:hypothetical protein
MKQVAAKGRLLLRKILTALSLGAVAFIFQACYGPPRVMVTGTVKSADTNEPVSGISVSLDEYSSGITDSNGKYRVLVADYGQTIISFRDINGTENGDFQDKNVQWDVKKNVPLNILLDRKL